MHAGRTDTCSAKFLPSGRSLPFGPFFCERLMQVTPPNDQWAVIAFVVTSLGAIIIAVTLFLDRRAKFVLAEGTAELRREVAELRARVGVLEINNREARGHIIDAIALASKIGNDEIIASLKKAQGILH